MPNKLVSSAYLKIKGEEYAFVVDPETVEIDKDSATVSFVRINKNRPNEEYTVPLENMVYYQKVTSQEQLGLDDKDED